jgi:uncharacterized protein DUF4252
MKLINSYLIKIARLGFALAIFAAVPVLAQDAKIEISQLDRFNERADKVISVDVNESLIKLAISALNPNRSPNEAKIKDILSGLKGVYVRRYEFEKENEFTAADVEAIRAQLNAPGWEKIANVRSKREGSYDMVMMYEGSVVKGIGLLAAEPRALTVVNVIGTIDIAKFRDLEGKFGIPSFGLEQMPGVTVKENRKTKSPDDEGEQTKPADEKAVIVERRAEKKPPQLIRPEKPPQER